jgi:hypothetical protein
MGRPKGSPNKNKIYRQALMMELAAAGDNLAGAREIVKVHIARCKAGDMQAIKEFADRLDGKVPQALTGDDDGDPVRHVVTWQETDE